MDSPTDKQQQKESESIKIHMDSPTDKQQQKESAVIES